jgi:hypothetical protein
LKTEKLQIDVLMRNKKQSQSYETQEIKLKILVICNLLQKTSNILAMLEISCTNIREFETRSYEPSAQMRCALQGEAWPLTRY